MTWRTVIIVARAITAMTSAITVVMVCSNVMFCVGGGLGVGVEAEVGVLEKQ